MPSKCCIIGCKSGYDTSKEKVHLFKIPKDEELRIQWLKAIGRKDFKPGRWTSVCSKHFQEVDIVKYSTEVVSKTGEKLVFHSQVQLRKGAVPSTNLNTSYERKISNAVKNKKLSVPKRSSRKRRTSKAAALQSEPENSSDEDIPLEKIKNQCLHTDPTKTTHIPDKSITEDSDDVACVDSDRLLKKKITKLLDDYEQLKNKSIGLDQEIKVLEKVNVELKCTIFKN